MSERWVPEIVRKSNGFGEALITSTKTRESTRDLSDFKDMIEPGSEDARRLLSQQTLHLSLVLQLTKRPRMDDPVAVDLVAGAAGVSLMLVVSPSVPRRGVNSLRAYLSHTRTR